MQPRALADLDEPAIARIPWRLAAGLGRDAADPLVGAGPVPHTLVRRTPAGISRLDPGGLAPARDEADARPAGAGFDVSDAGHEPRALARVDVLDAGEEEGHGRFDQRGAEGRVERDVSRCRDDARCDAADEVGDGSSLTCGYAGSHHRRGRHGWMGPDGDDVGHVVERPQDADVVAAILQGVAEGCGYGLVVFCG